MIRNSTKMTALTAVALLGGTVAFNCSKSGSDADFGHVTLALTLPDGTKINTVHYDIKSGTPTGLEVQGDINTSDPNATPTADVSFKVSTGDTVTLTADTTATPPVHCTGTSAPFPVTQGATAVAMVNLNCGGQVAGTPGVGNIDIEGKVVAADNCPQLNSWTVSPLTTSVGGTIDVSASASDADIGDTLTYACTPASKFTSASSAMTQYHCTTPGADTVTITVTDTKACPVSMSFAVNCVGTTGAAGAGAAGAGAAGMGAAGAGAAGMGAAGAGAAGMGAAGAGAAGMGAAGAGAAGSGAAGAGLTACQMCENSHTGNVPAICHNTSIPSNISGAGKTIDVTKFGCNGFTGQQQTDCLAALACIRGSACQADIVTDANNATFGDYNSDDATACLCGTAQSSTACATVAESALVGVCATQLLAAFHDASPPAGVTIQGVLFDNTFPVGVANTLLGCDMDVPCTCP